MLGFRRCAGEYQTTNSWGRKSPVGGGRLICFSTFAGRILIINATARLNKIRVCSTPRIGWGKQGKVVYGAGHEICVGDAENILAARKNTAQLE